MVTTSPIKPSSLKMLRHKKQQQPVEDDVTTNDVEITPTYDEETGSENMQTTITPSAAPVNASSTTDGGGGGRKSRLSLFRKSSSAASSNSGGGGAAGENNGQGNDSSNSNNGGGSGDSNNNNNGKGKDNNDDENKTENDEEDNDKKTKRTPQSSSSSSNNSNNNNPLCPSSTTIFNKERIEFAQKSTLPIHTGSESTAPTSHPSWTPVDGTEFKVRTGPNYPKNGQKINSGRSLYEVYAVRFYQSEKRTLGGATRIMPLPEMTPPRTVIEIDEQQQQQQMDQSTVLRGNPFKPLASTARSTVDSSILAELNESVGNVALGENAPKDDDVDTDGMLPGGNKSHPEFKDTKIPDVLVVHFFLPYEPPNMFKQKDDGRGGECVYYLRPSQRFLDEVSGKIPPTPATKLFIKWCNECESDFKMRSRFKCMALVRDIEKHNMGLLKSYNGKPVLITESGRVNSGYHGDIRYLEMSANVHYWAFMAKKGFVSLIPKFKSMQMEVGFTIEAHADSEMPECMLGSTTLSYISESTGPLISEEMQQPVHEHQS
jgi:hypothetical protein